MTLQIYVTGLRQVSGRSEIRDFDTAVCLDREYIENWYLKQDIHILFTTVGVVLCAEVLCDPGSRVTKRSRVTGCRSRKGNSVLFMLVYLRFDPPRRNKNSDPDKSRSFARCIPPGSFYEKRKQNRKGKVCKSPFAVVDFGNFSEYN